MVPTSVRVIQPTAKATADSPAAPAPSALSPVAVLSEPPCRIGSATAADEVATTTASTSGRSGPTSASTNPAGTATAIVSSAARAAGRTESRRPGSRSGRRLPTTNISIAKPTSDRNAVVGSPASIHPSPERPSKTPAAISPTTRGRPSRGSAASNGPASPAVVISARSPNVTPASSTPGHPPHSPPSPAAAPQLTAAVTAPALCSGRTRRSRSRPHLTRRVSAKGSRGRRGVTDRRSV